MLEVVLNIGLAGGLVVYAAACAGFMVQEYRMRCTGWRRVAAFYFCGIAMAAWGLWRVLGNLGGAISAWIGGG